MAPEWRYDPAPPAEAAAMTLFWLYIYALIVAMLFAGGTAHVTRNEPLARCAAALLVNWLVGMAVSFMGWTDAWPVNIPLDALTAVVILIRPAGRWQSALGVTYCIQIVMHIGYGALLTLKMGADAMAYYTQLTGVAFLQLAILGGWGIDLWGRRVSGRGAHRRPSSVEAGSSGMVEP